MTSRIKVVDIELSRRIEDITDLEGYDGLKGLARLKGTPLGYIDLPIQRGVCSATSLCAAVHRSLTEQTLRTVIRQRLDQQPAAPTDAEPTTSPTAFDTGPTGGWPRVTVAVCTRDRTAQLADCLRSLSELAYDNLELLVVDNAPTTDETQRLVQESFPNVRYVREPRPGLDWARNRAINEASGDILAYTDDDVVVDPHWITALARVFVDDPRVMVVTGLVVPFELETRAQLLFEAYGGFGRGFRRQWHNVDTTAPGGHHFHFGSGRFGTGANMAFRRTVFDRIGGFDPALDVGTVTNGGGDLEMFFRALQEGRTLVYEPEAIVRHRHRRTLEELRVQLRNHGIGLYSHLARSAKAYPRLRWSIIRFGLWWMGYWNLRRLLKSLVTKPRIPRTLIFAELHGSLIGVTRYARAQRNRHDIEQKFTQPLRTGPDGTADPFSLAGMHQEKHEKP